METWEPVNLFIKTSKQPLESVQNYCKQIKDGLKIRQNYKEEIIVAGHLNREDYISVLSQCHCFVMPSRGEAFCIPALEAMALNIPILYTENTGLEDFCVGRAVSSSPTPCFGAVSTLPDLDTANSTWQEIDIIELSEAMRTEFMKWNTQAAKEEADHAKEIAKQYDHKVVGQKLKDLLYGC